MRVGLLDDPEEDGWRLRPNRFWALGERLAEAGNEAVVVGARPWPGRSRPGLSHHPLAASAIPLLTSLNRALDAAPLTRAYALGRQLGDLALDLVIAPLGGGLAHGLLMARDCGEGFAGARVALWCDESARAAMIAADRSDEGLRPLVADALERACLRRADALVADDDAAVEALAAFDIDVPPVFRAALPQPPTIAWAQDDASAPARTLAFVGRLDRATGAVAFIDAVEALDRAGRLVGTRVVFIGPYRRAAPGVSAAWLGLRAAAWRFPFALIEETDPLAAMQRLAAMPGAVAVVAVDPGGRLPFQTGGRGKRLALTPRQIGAPDFAERLGEALAGTTREEAAESAQSDWPALVERLAALPRRPPAKRPASGVSVCVLTKDRPRLLAHALASVPRALGADAPFEIVLIDNGSSGEETKTLVARVGAERPEIRVLRIDPPVHPTVAYGRGVEAARHDVIAFLDDDNAYDEGGLARLTRGVLDGRCGVVVSTLDVFDHRADEPGPGVARWTFVGEAGSAGLFFNAFGDTALAMRRDLFLSIGGFPTQGGPSPAFDWVMLARAQAAGASIAVLQAPAVRYRRDVARAGSTWMKSDKENGRSRVFAAYGAGFDAELVARYAQKRQIEDG